MSKRSIPINDVKWNIKGQFATDSPVYELLSPAQLYKMKKRNAVDGGDQMEPASKTLARKKVGRIDDLESQGIKLKESAYLESLAFHWWDRDDSNFFWDLK